MRDCSYERDTGIGNFEERDSGNNHLNEPELGCPLTRIYEEIYLLSHEKHQAHRLSSIQEAVGLLSDTLKLLRGNENYIRSEVANLSKILNGPQENVV